MVVKISIECFGKYTCSTRLYTVNIANKHFQLHRKEIDPVGDRKTILSFGTEISGCFWLFAPKFWEVRICLKCLHPQAAGTQNIWGRALAPGREQSHRCSRRSHLVEFPQHNFYCDKRSSMKLMFSQVSVSHSVQGGEVDIPGRG